MYDYASFFKRQNDRDTPKTIREYVYCLFYKHCIAFCFYLGSQFCIKLLLSVSRLLYLGSQFFIKLLLSVSRLLYLGSQFFTELLFSVEQNLNHKLAL